MHFSSYFLTLALAASTTATLDFIDAISSSTGTKDLDFTGLVFGTPFTIGWVDGASAVNVSVWLKNADASSTFIETISSGEDSSGSIDWTPSTSAIPSSARTGPPRNNNIIGARDNKAHKRADEETSDLHLTTNIMYRITVSDDETTVFSPGFMIAPAASEKKKSSSGMMKLSTNAIIAISVAGGVTLLAVLGLAAFMVYRKKMQRKAERLEILKGKIDHNGSFMSL